MTASPGTAEAGSPPAQAPADSGSPSAGIAGRVFRQVTVLPTLLATAWLLAGLPLLLIGHFAPVPMLVIFVPLAGLLVTLGLRWISGPSQGLRAQREAEPARTPWWTIAALIAVAIAFGVDMFIHHSQQIIVTRDPASYIQFGNWIARHGSLPIPEDAAAFGGYSHSLSFGSPAFYQVGHTIVPQFMAGLPMTLAASFWVGGINLAVASGVLLGSCGVLTFGGLVGRLVGPRWAPLGALILALSLPEMYTSKSTFSEPLVQILFLGGLCLVIDSFSPAGAARHGTAALAGLALGLTLLVRIDGASDLLPLIPYCGLLLLAGRRQAWALIGGVTIGALYGVIDGVVLSQPYLTSIRSSLRPLLAVVALLFVVTAIVVMVLSKRGLPELKTDRLPNIAAAAAFVVTLALVIRPYVQTTRGKRTHAQAWAMAHLQAALHLPRQPHRLYDEITIHWVFWYVGVPAVILATIGTAVLARRCLRGQAPAWTLPLMSFAWVIVATLIRPAIMPDQPWGSRRLVPGVLPGIIVLSVWAMSWLVGWLRERGAGTAIRAGVIVVLAAALILPTARTSFGLAHKSGGPLGIRIVQVGLAERTTYKGQIAAVHDLCAAIPANSSVLIVDRVDGNSMSQVIRGMCGVPVARVRRPTTAKIELLIQAIRRAGRHPVLLGQTQGQLAHYGGQPTRVVALHGYGDPHTLVTPPLHPTRLRFIDWISDPSK